MEMNLILVGISHKTASIELREKLAIPQDRIPEYLRDLIAHEEIQEALILSTCNRTEMYAFCEDVPRGIAFLKDQFKNLSSNLGEEATAFLYVHEGREAMHHFFRVTSSLDAMVVGEAQILGQVREAYVLAEETGTVGPFLNYLAPRAFHIAKKVRTETEIARHPISMSYVAVQLAEKIFGDLSEKKVLLVGAGEMMQLAAIHFQERKIAGLYVTNRTRDHADKFAKEFHGTLLPFDNFISSMGDVDIVMTSTGAEAPLITERDVQEVMKRRKNRPMFFIDIAVPRDVESKVNDVANVYLYDMDDLQEIINENLGARQKEAARAEEVVKKELEGFLDYLRQKSMAPTIAQLAQKFEDIRQKEADKLLSKSLNWTEEQKKAIEEGTRSIANKILHGPIVTLKKEGILDEGSRMIDFIKRLFHLDGE